jgi:DNA-binding CsgD family transcriptional regulator
MQRYFEHIEALGDVSEVLWYAAKVCEGQGVLRQSYHFSPVFDAPNSRRTVVHARGYSREWLDLYDDADFRSKDPIPGRVMQHGQLLTWKEARAFGLNTSENEEFFRALERHGLVHGIGVPLFGPRGRDAYASIDFGRPIEQVSEESLGIVRSVLQAAHQRVCILLDLMRTLPDLSEREREVLHWIVRGKSFSVIADILELSPDTVKTYAKRIYAKLGTSDRVGAAVKALKLGLVKN